MMVKNSSRVYIKKAYLDKMCAQKIENKGTYKNESVFFFKGMRNDHDQLKRIFSALCQENCKPQ